MHTAPLNTTNIYYFNQLAKYKNITKAAKNLGLSQPSLSLALKNLEKETNTKLCIRHKKGIKLTPSGEILLLESKIILEHLQQLKSKIQTRSTEITGGIQIGCHPSVALYSLKLFLPKLIKDHPKLSINLTHDLSRNIVNQVLDFSVDIALAINPIKHPDLIIKPLCKNEVGLWENPNKLNSKPLILADTRLNQSQNILKKLKKNTYQIMQVDNLEVLTQLTIAGLGTGLLPEPVVNIFNKNNKIKKVKSSPIIIDELCLVYHVENKYLASIQTCINYIKNSSF